MRAPTVNVKEFMSSNSCKIAFANLAVHVPNADNRTWCGAKRSSNFFFSFLLFYILFFFRFFFKKLDVGRVYQDEELSLTQQPLTNSKSTKNMQKLAVKWFVSVCSCSYMCCFNSLFSNYSSTSDRNTTSGWTSN